MQTVIDRLYVYTALIISMVDTKRKQRQRMKRKQTDTSLWFVFHSDDICHKCTGWVINTIYACFNKCLLHTR